MCKKRKSFLICGLVLCCLTACHGATGQPATESDKLEGTESVTDSMNETLTEDMVSEPESSNDVTESESESSVDVTESEQSVEERIVALMYDYVEIAGKLKLHEFGNTIQISTGNREHSYTNNDALKYAYHKLIELEEIDPWLNEESWTELIHPQGHPDFDRQGFLDDFFVLKDVPLHVTYDTYRADGSRVSGDDELILFHYNPDGTLCYIDGDTQRLEEYLQYYRVPGSNLIYRYDNNKIVRLDWYGDSTKQNTHWTREYNKKGQLASEYYTDEKLITERIDYIYNKSGQLIQSKLYEQMDFIEDLYPVYYSGTFTDYTYDENGLLIRKERRRMHCDIDGNPLYPDRITTWEYSYDTSGKLVFTARTVCAYTILDSEQGLIEASTPGVSHISYEYDEKDRLLTKTTEYIPPEEVKYPDFMSEVVKEVETYIYGDYYMHGQYTIP